MTREKYLPTRDTLLFRKTGSESVLTAPLKTLFGLSVLTIMTGCSPAPPTTSDVSEGLRNAIRAAKARGQDSVTNTVTGQEGGVGQDLDALARRDSFLVAEVTGRSAVDTSGNQLRTWHLFKTVESGGIHRGQTWTVVVGVVRLFSRRLRTSSSFRL